MPQIWLTYQELGALMGCDAATARAKALTLPLDRRRSRDGHTRVKLSPMLTESFLEGIAREWVDREIAACAADLFALRDKMAALADHRDNAHPEAIEAAVG